MIKSIVIIFLVLFMASGCAKEPQVADETASQAKNLEDGVTQEVSTFTLSSVGDDGQSNWELEGETADIMEDKVNLSNVKIKSESMGSSVTMEAKKGVIKKSENKGTFKNDVVLAYDDGTTLATDTIDWSFKNEIATAPGAVFVKSAGLETKAMGARLDKSINKIQLNKDVFMNTPSGTTIKCSGPLVLDYKENTAVFKDNVVIENPKGTMASSEMVVFFDPDKKKILKVNANGGVRLIRGNSISVSEEAVYFAEEGKAILTGNPVIFIDSKEADNAFAQDRRP